MSVKANFLRMDYTYLVLTWVLKFISAIWNLVTKHPPNISRKFKMVAKIVRNIIHFWEIIPITQCPRTDSNKIFLPRPKTTTPWKLIPHRSKINKNWNHPHWVPLHRFFKNWFLLIQKQLYSTVVPRPTLSLCSQKT